MFLKGIYRDIYAVAALTEEGTVLTEAAAYNDDGDFYIDAVKGRLVRIDNAWSRGIYAIKMTCSVGLGVGADGSFHGATARLDIKQVVMEMAGAKSGLWKNNVISEGGTITSIRTTPSKMTMDVLKKYRLRSV